LILCSIEEMVMSKKQPNKFIAPIVIAGITVGFFISAYKFVFAQPKQITDQIEHEDAVNKSLETKDEKK
jgi:membrane-anchored glycerophosphoryl diester phosphodiesterase (GDPDase)